MEKANRPGLKELLPILLRDRRIQAALAIEVAVAGGLYFTIPPLLEILSTPRIEDPCLDSSNLTLSICSSEKTAEIMALPLLRNLSQNADSSIKPTIDGVLDTISEMIDQNQLTFYEFNDPNANRGMASYGTLENGEAFFEMVLPQGKTDPIKVGIKMHEAYHIAKAEQNRRAGKKSPFGPEDKKLAEYQVAFLGNYMAYLARTNNQSEAIDQQQIDIFGIDMPLATNFLLDNGYTAESNLYQCLYELSLRYIWKGRNGLADNIIDKFLLDSDTKAEIAQIEKRCLNPYSFAPKGSKEWEMLLQIKRKGLIANNFIPNLPKDTAPLPKPKSQILPPQRLGKEYGLGTPKGIPSKRKQI
jgi:hypothetical protein